MLFYMKNYLFKTKSSFCVPKTLLIAFKTKLYLMILKIRVFLLLLTRYLSLINKFNYKNFVLVVYLWLTMYLKFLRVFIFIFSAYITI